MTGTYVVAGRTPWTERVFLQRLVERPGNWHYVSTRTELDVALSEHHPDTVFFLHWSWMVPPEVLSQVRCINFHMTDLPYGRGGSPLQNLIVRGHRTTMVSAIVMTEEFDAGPVLLKAPLDLGGTAEDIYIRATEVSADLIIRILDEEPSPMPQSGRPTVFERRTPGESELPTHATLRGVHDHIRMLDADGYPPAFIRYSNLRLEFRRAALYDGKVVADVEIRVENDVEGDGS